MWTLRQTGDGWELVDGNGNVYRRGTFGHLSAIIAAATPPDRMHWQGPIVLEGIPTGDGRLAEPGAWKWETPFPLDWRPEDGGHFGRVVGTVWEVERQADGSIMGRGTFDLGAPATDEYPEGIGMEAARHVAEGLTDNVSIVPDTVTVELRVRAEVIEEIEDSMEAADDNEVAVEDEDVDEDGRIVLDEYRHDDWLEVTTDGRIRTLGLVTTAAHDACTIELADGLTLDDLRAMRNGAAAPEPAATDDVATEGDVETVAAAGPWQVTAAAWQVAEQAPPDAWFDNPQLDGPTALVVEDSGRLYAHLAAWDTCHIGRDDVCLTAPQSATGYAYFTTGAVEAGCEPCAASGGRPVRTIPTGTITMGTGHADLTRGPRAAAAHYDDTGTAVADVAVGEDEHGIWIAGALRPTATVEQVRALRGSSLSGDWRRIGGSLELVAALAVNVPGFPIPRARGQSAADALAAAAQPQAPRAHVEHGDQLALVASGIVPRGGGSGFAAGGIVDDLLAEARALGQLTPSLERRVARIERALHGQIAADLRSRVT